MKLDHRQPRVFADQLLPADCSLVGMAALAHAFDVAAPLRFPAVVSHRHIRGSVRCDECWTVYDKRYEPGETVADHLSFALRHENLDLLVLKRLFLRLPEAVMTAYVRSAPTGTTHRRAWFLYEFLTGRTLDVPDAPQVAAIDLLDPERYFVLPGRLSRRHRVKNNLLGTREFCPVIRRTPRLDDLIEQRLGAKVQEVVGQVSKQLIARAASFLLLADSKASFQIEGERPPRNRLERWGKAVLQAGKAELTREELERLHGILIEDHRFVQPGLRQDGVFLGERAADGDPLPEFVGARPEDLEGLLEGLLRTNAAMRAGDLDPVLQAAVMAFGFVYIHPFEDGNGRLQRYLIHHVLAERKFSPPGVVFPISSVMLDRLEDFRKSLQAHSAPLMSVIDWRPTDRGNVEVLNDTSDLYRYVDITDNAEFLYACVQRTIDIDWPRELDHLRRHDKALRRMMAVVELPDRLAGDVLMFIRQNDGVFPKRRRQKEFAALTDAEVRALEGIVNEAFEGF